MKALVIDAGNTRIKWAIVDSALAGRLQCVGAIAYADADYSTQLAQLWLALPSYDRVLLACVAGDRRTEELVELVGRVCHFTVEVLHSESKFAGMVNGYRHPRQLGVDRWLAMIGGRSLSDTGLPMWIIDCGTAVTIDYVDSNGDHQGGLILPGLMMMHERLTLSTANLSATAPFKELSSAAWNGLARDTEMAMSRGIMTALVAAIDRIVAEHDDGPKTIRLLGGGDAPRVAPFLAGHWQLQADLVLLGMAEYVRVS